MTPEQLKSLDLAVRYLKTLSAVERAHALGDDDDVEGTLGGVDPVDLKEVTRELEVLQRSHSVGVEFSEETQTAFDITHAGDIWSRKV